MTQNKKFKKLVRARMKETGESYMQARRALGGDAVIELDAIREGVEPGMFQFFGETYVPARDFARLKNNVQRVFSRLLDGEWHTITDLQEVGGSAARTRVSNLKVAFEMPILSAPVDEWGKLWKYRLVLKEVDPEMARRVLEDDLTEELKAKLRTPSTEKSQALRKELHKLLDRVPEDRLVEAQIALEKLVEETPPDLDFGWD